MSAFDWDSTIKNDGNDFKLLDEGIHPFRVKSLEKERYEGGKKFPPCPMATLILRVGDGDEQSDVKANLHLCSENEWKLCQFFTAIGDRKHGEELKMDWDHVVGKTGWLETEHYEMPANGEYEARTVNSVARYLDPEDAPKQAVAQQAPAQGGGTWTGL